MSANWGVTNFKWQVAGWKIMPHFAFFLVGITQCETALSSSIALWECRVFVSAEILAELPGFSEF